MKFNWNEMSSAQKLEAVVTFGLAFIGLAFILLDLTGTWPNKLHYPVLCVMSLFEGIMSWNKNRKIAITEFVCAAFFAAYTFL